MSSISYRSVLSSFSNKVYLLDEFPARVAYSFRRLSSTYMGNCIQVIRSSDNATQNIGFVNDFLDTASLLSFVGTGTGRIKIWYDQSGNANNAIQNDIKSLPIIVSSGVLITKNGITACFHSNSGNEDFRLTTVLNPTTNEGISIFSVFTNETTGNDASYLIPFGTNTPSTYLGVIQDGSSSSPDQNFTNTEYYKNSVIISPKTRDSMDTAFRTGVLSLSTALADSNPAVGVLFLTYASSSNTGNFYTSEVVLYKTKETTNRSNIETLINDYYSIY